MHWLRLAAAVLSALVLVGCFILFSLHLTRIGPCARGFRPCPSSTDFCIPQRSWCNKHADCPNGDDETKLGCADLSGSSEVLNVALSSRRPPTADRSCQLARFPKQCTCKHKSVSCGSRNLTAVPLDISADVTKLLLFGNAISELDEASLVPYEALTHIHLADNRIRRIGKGTFRGKQKLVRLLLTRNGLQRWEAADGELSELGALEWLFLDENVLLDGAWPLDQLGALPSLSWLNLAWNKLKLDNRVFPAMSSLRDLNLTGNSIRHIGEKTFQDLKMMTMLILDRNDIRSIHPAAFASLTNLQELSLSHNKLKSLPGNIFDSLTNLSKLNLGANPIYIPGHLLSSLKNLTSLSLEGISMGDIDVSMVAELPLLNHVYLKSYYYCSFVPHVPVCKPNNDGVSSMENLLHALPLRWTVWLVCALTVSANLLVLSGRAALNDDNKVLSLVIRSLAAADLLMGLYLLVIACADLVLRGQYHRHAHAWMTSWPCTLAGAVSMLSSEVSVLTLVFMSMDRFLLIADPLGRHQLSYGASARSVAAIWVSGAVLALLPVAVHWRTSPRFYGTNGMCFPLHIDDPFLVGWQYSAFVFLGVNGTSLILVGVLYLGMFLSIVRTRRATPLALGDVDVAVRFFFIVLTDACCWAPVAVMKTLALCGVHISAELYAWVVVFLVPINSAVNPLLYTLTIPKYRAALLRMLRRVSAGCYGVRVGSRRQSADTECSRASQSNRIQMTSSTFRTRTEVDDVKRLPQVSQIRDLLASTS